MPDLIPLPIWGATAADLDALKAAKAALQLPYLITPCEAVPGSPSRILALREPPPFIHDYALVADPTNPAAMEAAMYWALHPDFDDARASLEFDQLNAIMPGIKEVFDVPTIDDYLGY